MAKHPADSRETDSTIDTDEVLEQMDRPCNRSGCDTITPTGAHAYCSLRHELLDWLTGNVLYEGIRDE